MRKDEAVGNKKKMQVCLPAKSGLAEQPGIYAKPFFW
jgi:hypothetical protein